MASHEFQWDCIVLCFDTESKLYTSQYPIACICRNLSQRRQLRRGLFSAALYQGNWADCWQHRFAGEPWDDSKGCFQAYYVGTFVFELMHQDGRVGLDPVLSS